MAMADDRDLEKEKTKASAAFQRRDLGKDVQLDYGKDNVRIREHWWQIWVPKTPPRPPPESLDDAPITPLVNASWLSKLTYWWINDLMILGYRRTLQASDLWQLDPTRQAGVLSVQLDEAWDRRVLQAREWNEAVARGEKNPGLVRRVLWDVRSLAGGTPAGYRKRRAEFEARWRVREASLAWALNDVFKGMFWSAGAFKIIGDTAQLMGPILIRSIINFAKARAQAQQSGTPVPHIGSGVGEAIGLFLVTVTYSVFQHQFFWRSMMTGVLARAALINSIYKRAVKLSGKSRASIPNSALVNHISTDVSRIDAAAQFFHAIWTAPIQLSICLIILLVQLGPSALVGFLLFFLIAPIQQQVMAFVFRERRRSMKFADARAKVLLEVLGSMRIVKYFCYEMPFIRRISEIRRREMKGIRRIQTSQSANLAFAFSVPVMAATLSFITYTETTAQFDVAIIFSSLSLFNLLRQPMMFLPRSLSATADARNALTRLIKVFQAETMSDDPLVVDDTLDVALRVEKATFTWEAPPQAAEDQKRAKKKKEGGGGGEEKKSKEEEEREKEKEREESRESSVEMEEGESEPFEVVDVDMEIQRGMLVAIVGRVGSGKSSLLSGLIGEMRRTKGSVVFGGSVAYCSQTAWIQNATLRENVLFGQAFEEDRYWKAIEASCLIPDLELLPDGDLTEIGEKGINLSGGQKQRINICRALYNQPDVVILDDPLSAVDAHVGKTLFNTLLDLKNTGATVILVTHALHFLSQCDFIYGMSDGRLAESGTYASLLEEGGEVARLVKEFGGSNNTEEEKIPAATTKVDEGVLDKLKEQSEGRTAAGTGKLEGKLIVKETRMTGGVKWSVYGMYLKAANGYWSFPLILFASVFLQATQIINNYTLVWWQQDTFHRGFSFYEIIYAALGIGQCIGTFMQGFMMDIAAANVSRNLHHFSVVNIFHAPMSFFDTTPLGRIMSVFGKDVDTMDNQLTVSMRLLILTLSNVFGSVVIIAIFNQYFLVAAFFIFLGYNFFGMFYRSSALEMKRIDAILRSFLYAHFSESLSGLPTIRSYRGLTRFINDNKYYIDLENRALVLTVTNQRWLAIRADCLGACLVFFVAIFAVVGVSGIDAAQIGLILTYTTSLTQFCSVLTRQSAEVENYMNSVERLVHYGRKDLIPQEAAHEVPDHKPPTQWPSKGEVIFRDVEMRYRPNLPNVLHGISLKIQGGEKIGICGRTGAGKSSIILTLLRIVEFGGTIEVDGVDISKIGLRDLRGQISTIPQEPILFSGTVRESLDPFSLYDDARLNDALRRAHVTNPAEVHSGSRSRITLDTQIESEGNNLSVGERSLLSIARALVKDSQIVIMDEATASVDLETDSKIQGTITTEFKGKTLLCIAHRLRTILSYDRILVLEEGRVAEYDSPLTLFDQPDSLFRSLCKKSDISRQDILDA